MSFAGPVLVAALLVCVVVGVVAGACWGLRRGSRSAPRTPEAPVRPTPADRAASARAATDHEPLTEMLQVLASAAVVLDPGGAVVLASEQARAKGFVKGTELVHDRLRDLVREVRRDGVVRDVELELTRGFQDESPMVVGVRVGRLENGDVLLLIDDRTHAKQVEETRRDFVANVSHELKTPVGGIALLAEAVLEAKDDPEAVDRFARRIVVESTRLTRLVREIVDLSRLQSSEALVDPQKVVVRLVAREALELSSALAEQRHITCELEIEGDPVVYGDAQLLRTAVANLLSNAVTYSPDGTRVVVTVRETGSTVEIAVADQGSGIAKIDQPRVFERFYRVDAARSRATGGTGLGLAIVKHIATNHGGEVTLWSSPGHGSTFTIRLPSASDTELTHAWDTHREEAR